MTCPKCGKENFDNWPITVNNEIIEGGCQDCFEKECDREWWKIILVIDKVVNLEGLGKI